MGIHSGKTGVVNDQSTVRNWSIVDTLTLPKFVASNMRFGTGRRRGVGSWTGNFGQYGVTPTVLPGDIFSFLGYTAPTNDTPGTNGERATGDAIVNSVQLNWNWRGGEILNSVVNFAGHLAVTFAQGADIDDDTDPNVPEVGGLIIEYNIGGGWVTMDSIVSAALTISADNKDYVNSGTYVGVYPNGQLWTGRKSGPIDWTLAIVQENEIRGAYALQKGMDVQLRLYIDNTDFWLLKWGKVREFTNLNVDIETGNILGRTINIDMNGHDGTGLGEITLPGESTPWWPSSVGP